MSEFDEDLALLDFLAGEHAKLEELLEKDIVGAIKPAIFTTTSSNDPSRHASVTAATDVIERFRSEYRSSEAGRAEDFDASLSGGIALGPAGRSRTSSRPTSQRVSGTGDLPPPPSQPTQSVISLAPFPRPDLGAEAPEPGLPFPVDGAARFDAMLREHGDAARDRALADQADLPPPPIGEDDFSYPPAPYPQAPGSSASHSHYGSDASAAFGRGTAYSGAGGLMSPAMSSTPSVGVFSSGGRYGADFTFPEETSGSPQGDQPGPPSGPLSRHSHSRPGSASGQSQSSQGGGGPRAYLGGGVSGRSGVSGVSTPTPLLNDLNDLKQPLPGQEAPGSARARLYHPAGSMEYSPGMAALSSSQRRGANDPDLHPEEIPTEDLEAMYEPVSSSSHGTGSVEASRGLDTTPGVLQGRGVMRGSPEGGAASSSSSYQLSMTSQMSLGALATKFDLDRYLNEPPTPVQFPGLGADKEKDREATPVPAAAAPAAQQRSRAVSGTGAAAPAGGADVATEFVKPQKRVSINAPSPAKKPQRPASAGRAAPAQRSAQAQTQMRIGAASQAGGGAPPAPAPRPRPRSAPRAASVDRRRGGAASGPSGLPPGPDPFSLSVSFGGHTKEAVKQRVDQQAEKNMPFRPKFYTKASTRAHAAPDGEDWLRERAAPRSAYWERMMQKRAELDKEDEAEFTGKPKTGRPPENHPYGDDPDLPPSERLYRVAMKWEQNRVRKAAERDAAEVEDCTFVPRRNPGNDRKALPEDYKPIYERVDEVVKKRQEAVAKKAQELHPEPPFRPVLNPQSLRMAETRDLRDDIFLNERIARGIGAGAGSAGAAPRRARSEAGGDAATPAARDELECTFQPRINAQSRLIAELDPNRPATHQERLRYYEELKSRRHQEIEERALKDAGLTFRPDVSATNLRVLEKSSRGHVLTESYLEKVERLSTKEAERREALRHALAESIYGKFDFKPKINAASRKLVPGYPTVEELTDTSRQRLAREHNAAREEERRRKECTFQPDTSKPRIKGAAFEAPPSEARVVDFKSDPDYMMAKIRAYLKDKESLLAAKRAELAQAEVDACTFKPEVSPEVPREVLKGGPVLVPGLSRFLDNRDRAKRLEVEQKEREDRAFWARAAELPPKASPTVPEPFRLSSEVGSLAQRLEVRRVELDERVRREEERNFTFRPDTNEARRRQELRNILAEVEP